MENASKALMMAGGILIAIILASLLVRSFGSMQKFQMSQLTEEEQKKLIAFNEQYTKYLGRYVYGYDVLSLINKYDYDGNVRVILAEGSEEPTEGENNYEKDLTNNNYSSDTRYYKCINIEYNNTNGRVSSITFEQVKMNAEIEDI